VITTRKGVEYNSRSALRRLQTKRLRGSLSLAYERTRLYRRKFKEAGIRPSDIKTIDDLVKVPFSTKKEIAEDYVAAVAEKVSVWHTTSGTSGSPTIVGFSKVDMENQILLEERNLRIAGVTERDVVHNVTPYGMFFAGTCLHDAARRIGATVIPAGKMPTSKQQALIVDLFKPTVIVGVPQFILKLSYTYEEEYGKDPAKASLRKAYALGEPLPEAVRKKIEDRWNADVRIGYGLTEAGSGAECEEKKGVHWAEDQSLAEIVDPETGERVGEGEDGEVVFTTLTRTGTMAIRFRSNDETHAILEECSCGRTLIRLLPPKYRFDDLVKIRGTLTSPYAIDDAIFEYPEIRNYLFVVEKDRTGVIDQIKIFLEATREDPKTVDSLSQKLGGGICVSPNFIKYVPMGSIPSIGRKEARFIDLRKETAYRGLVRGFMQKYG